MGNYIKNRVNVKIDDIFYTDRHCGVDGHYIQFFQVVKLKDNNEVVVREIKRKIISIDKQENVKIGLVIPCKSDFTTESTFIEDNSIGISKQIQNNLDDKIYITMSPFSSDKCINAYLWDGEPKKHYNDLFKYINEEKI